MKTDVEDTGPTAKDDNMCDAPSPSISGLDGSAAAAETIIEAEAETEEDAANAPPPVAGLGKVRRSVSADKTLPGYIFSTTEWTTVDVGMLGIATDGEVGGGSSRWRRQSQSDIITCPKGCVDCRDCRVHGVAVSCPDGSHPDVSCQEEYCDDSDGAATSSTSSGDCAGLTTFSMAGTEEEDRASIPACFQLAGFNESVPTIVSNDSVAHCRARNCSGATAAASSAA